MCLRGTKSLSVPCIEIRPSQNHQGEHSRAAFRQTSCRVKFTSAQAVVPWAVVAQKTPLSFVSILLPVSVCLIIQAHVSYFRYQLKANGELIV